MEEKTPRLNAVINQIDELNAADPNKELMENFEQPRELVYSIRLTDWVKKLKPGAGELLLIAARGQHVLRWTRPRADYPMDRGGYLRWREDLKKFHAETVTGLMQKEGYGEQERNRVRDIILKKNLREDPDAQAVEDGLCLVFLESQYDELKRKTPDDKMKEIIRKTWGKMSEAGRQLALKLPLPDETKKFILSALETS